MRTTVEWAMIIIVSMCSVSATATLIHDTNAHRSTPLTRFVNHEWQGIQHWLKTYYHM